MLIEILGTGCANCKRLAQITGEVVNELGIDARIEHIEELEKIMTYPIMSTPALVIDGVVKASGRVPSKEELHKWLQLLQE